MFMKERDLKTGQGKIRYWVNDVDPKRKSLVFLPGLTADHRLFVWQVRYFKDDYNVLVWDAPGHGKSRPFSLDFSLMDKARWLQEILHKEGITNPYLIGQSMGGYVAQCYIQRFPGKVAGFISIDSAPLKRKYMTKWELWLLKHCEPVYRYYPWRALLASGSKGCATSIYGQNQMRAMMNSFHPREYSRLAGHGFRILAEAIEKDLPYELDCPTLLLCGDKDCAGSTKRYNQRWTLEERIPLVWVRGAGHNSNVDAPGKVNRFIEAFVN